MKSFVILFALLTFISAQRKPNKTLIRAKILTQIKENSSWEAYPIEENPFSNYTHDDLHNFLGAELKWTHENIYQLIDTDDHSEQDNLPEAFDSRTQWPDCITPIRNQEHCGSCWAFSGVTALSDRMCIASSGKIKVILSPQYLVSCDKVDKACQGGMLDETWNFLETQGTVTDSCFSYKSGDGKIVPDCPSQCDKSSEKLVSYKAVKGSSKELTCPLQMQKEIMANGPVQTGFMVYEDFMHYKSGVYKHTTGKKLGGHAVRVVGWGKENSVNYWIVANTWGPAWGETGFFRIAFGECLFDANGYAGLADVHSSKKLFLH
jgi:cathepsin B